MQLQPATLPLRHGTQPPRITRLDRVPLAGTGLEVMDPNVDPEGSERLGRRHRMRVAADFALVRAGGTAFRGAHCLLAVCPRPGEPTRVGFIASRRGVGDAVRRNRARRRLREIVRRRWARMPDTGLLLLFIAFRSTPTAPHQDLACDVERLLTTAGALAPLEAEVL